MGQASHDVQHGQTPLRQPGPDLYYTPTTTRQAALYMNSGPIPMAQAGQNIQYDQAPARPAIYGEPRYPTTKFDGLIFGTSMVSGDCHFCASIVSEPAEQEAIIQDLCRTFPDSDAAAIIKQGPFWAQRLPITTAEHDLCLRGFFTHQGMMDLIRRQQTLPHPNYCQSHSPFGPIFRYLRVWDENASED
ncbi:MAG: hypothetical protein L6R36_005269 [Xanthoria steineri]|nr:MAG: hypothetical protein L6R36_005269 [Xanthoria steineri]